MAKTNAIIGVVQTDEPQAIFSSEHPPIYMTMPVKANQTGDILVAGTVVAKDAAGEVVPYDPAGTAPVNTPVGILIEDVDTTKETAAVVGVHGVAIKDRCNVKGSALASADIDKLKNIGIYVR